MTEFSRRVNVQIIKDEPVSRADWERATRDREADDFNRGYVAARDAEYARYLDRFQPYRWRAVAANNEPIAHGESYFNEADCINAVNLLAGDDTTVYVMPMYGEDRGEKLLRFGVTDRNSQEPPF